MARKFIKVDHPICHVRCKKCNNLKTVYENLDYNKDYYCKTCYTHKSKINVYEYNLSELHERYFASNEILRYLTEDVRLTPSLEELELEFGAIFSPM